MKAHIIRNLPKDGYDVYLFSETGDGTRLPVVFEHGRAVYSEVSYPPGHELPAAFFLEHPIYDALRKAMIGEAIDNDDALKDTRMIRDRLLAMIEAEWKSRQLERQ